MLKCLLFFAHVEYCDMHFEYGFCDGNARVAVEEYQRRFPNRRIPSRSVFTRIHQTLRDTVSLPGVSVQSEREIVRTINTRENILQMVQRSPRLSTLRMASSSSTARSYFGAAEHIRNHPDIITSATQSLLMRAENCIAAGGGHFEQLL